MSTLLQLVLSLGYRPYACEIGIFNRLVMVRLTFSCLDFFTQICKHILKAYYSITRKSFPTYVYIVGKEISSRI